MSEVEKTVDYKLRASSEGLENLTRFANEMDKAGIEAGELKDKAAEVSRQLQDVTQQQAAIDSLRQLGEESRNLGNRLDASTAQVERLAAALPEVTQKAQQLAQAETSAAEAVKQAEADVDTMQKALVELRSGHEQAARGSDEYKASVAQARSAITELRQQLTAQKQELAQCAEASKTAATEQASLKREYEAAVTSTAKVSAAVGENRRAMDTARESAKALGVDSSKLSEEQKRVDQAAREARAGLESAAAMCDRLRERQAAAAQAAKSFQEDLKKLGTEGPQAPAGLEAAFRKLGMGGVREAESAVHELQIALAQIKASGDILPADKSAAVAAFKQRVSELRGEAGQASAATTQLGGSVEGTGNKMAQAAHKAVAWTTALVGLQQLKSIAASVVETGSKFENLEVRLRNLLGSTEAAQSAFAMLKNLAASTPFEVAGLTEAFVKLTAFGMKPTEDQMRSLSNVAANLGGGTETLAGVTLALGQAWTKGKLQGEEIMQLAERGVPVWDALAKATGRTVPELQRMSEAGQLGRDVISKLIDELGRMNDGASERLMRTYAGAVANAKDALAEFFDMIAKAGVLDWLTDKIRGLLAEFERMKQTGELQAKAKEIADAFLNVANMAETVTRGLIAMAPVIEKAVTVWLAFKAVGIAQTLYAIAGGGAAAATGVAAAGTASVVAAGQMGTAATAAGALATSLRILRSLTGVGIALGVAELVTEFFKAKRAAEEGDAAVRKMLEAPPASNQPKKAVQEVNAHLEKTSFKAQDAITEFDRLMEQGNTTDEALSKIGKGFDLSNAPGIRDAAVVLDVLLQQGKITAVQFREEWQKQLKDVDLSDFELRARSALNKTWEGVGRLNQVIDAGLREAVRRAGGDFDVISGGMGKAAQSAINDTHLIIQNLDRLEKSGADVGRALTLSLSKAINTADSEKALEAVRSQVEQVRKQLGDKVADGLLDQAKEKANELKDAIDKATPGINSVREAMKQLGVTTDETLKKTATESQSAYETMRNSGLASARELSEGFKRAAEAAIAANKGIAPSWVTAEAGVRGYDLQVDQAGKTTLKLREITGSAAGGMSSDWRGVQSSIQEANRALQEYQQRVAQKYGRPGEGDANVFDPNRTSTRGEKLGEGVEEIGTGGYQFRNKDGMTSDAKGTVQTQGIWTRALIIDYLKQSGLDADVAEKLAEQFVQPDGSVDYVASDAQKRWGGKYATLSEALGKMVDFYKYGDGKHQYAQMSAEIKKNNAVNFGTSKAPTPAPTPAPSSSSTSGGRSMTYVSNITLNGKTTQVKFADQSSQAATEQLLRDITNGKGVY